MKSPKSESSPELDGPLPALGEAYAKALDMLPPERRTEWLKRITNRPRTRPMARGEIRSSTSRLPLAR
jgi:hypothetical protein